MAEKTDKNLDNQGSELEEKKQEKKPNIFVRGWRRVKSIGSDMRKNPVVAAAGAAIGAALALGGKAFIDHKLRLQDEGPLEIEDTGEEYIEEEPEEEVQEDE